jgi:hypothetical protein
MSFNTIRFMSIMSLNTSLHSTPKLKSLYDDLSNSFVDTLDRSDKGDRGDSNQRRRQITLHSFRRFVKTTISGFGYADFSEWFIGHSGSTYWTKRDSKAEIIRKIEPYLTFQYLSIIEDQRPGRIPSYLSALWA